MANLFKDGLTPTGRKKSTLSVGQLIHQSVEAKRMQAAAVTALLAHGYELGLHDELVATGHTVEVDTDKLMAEVEKLRKLMAAPPCAVSVGYRCDNIPQGGGTFLSVPTGRPSYDFKCGACGCWFNVGSKHTCK